VNTASSPVTGTLTRREALAMGLAAAVALPEAAHAANFFSTHKLPIGLQLYTVSDAAKADLRGSFERLAKIGFRTIELAGYHGHTPAELKATADHFGLKFTGIHLSDSSRNAGEPGLADAARLAADMRVLGIENVTMPILPFPDNVAPAQGEAFPDFFRRATAGLDKAYWQRTASLLNRRAESLAREGLRFSYHNHNVEFAPVEGTTGWDVLLAETDPKRLSFEMDVGWVAAAGRDPLELLKKHSGRIRQMHVKDILATTKPNYAMQQDPTEVGNGSLPWARILPAAHAAGVRHFYVEQEPPFTMDRFDAIAKSFRYLTAMG